VSVRRVDYEQHGRTYARHRRPDPRIAKRIHAALGGAQTVLNVGAGTGSYEPTDRWVLAVEPSPTMRAQRSVDAAPVISTHAEALPFDDDAVDAAMACATIHHWESPDTGLAELRRVSRGPVVVFTFELDSGRHGTGRVMRRRQRLAALSKILRVRRERLLDALSNLGSRSAERDNARQIGHVRTPATVFGLLVDHEILVHRRCSDPLARLMLPSVPTGTVSLSFPATTIRSPRSGCAQTS
jgi:SAM-dependent methyltransferase